MLSSAPVVDYLYATPAEGHTVNISGHVSDFDPDAGALQVALSGMIQALVDVDSGGNFNISGSTSSAGSEQAVAFDAGTGLSSDPFEAPLQNNPPVIMGLSAEPAGNGKYVMIFGTVEDEFPQGLTVNFSGVVSGSATTDANGSFSLYALASGLGSITATTSDEWGAAATPVTTQLYVSPPMVQLDDALADPSGAVTITGYVFDMSPGDTSVTISGVVNGSVTPDPSGSFTLTSQASGAGTFTATATDVWGQSSTSAPANLTIYDPPPQLTNLGATQLEAGIWLITGSVSDPTLGDVAVSYSGSASGSVTLNPDGTFSFEVYIDPNIQAPSLTVAVSDPSNAPSEWNIELI